MSITLSPEVLATLSDNDQMALVSTGCDTFTHDEARKLVSPEGFTTLTTTSCFEQQALENADKAKRRKQAEGYLQLAGYSFLPRTAGDKKFVNKEMPLEKASKALLLDLIEAMGTNIGEMARRLELSQETHRQISKQEPKVINVPLLGLSDAQKANCLRGSEKLQALKDCGMWQQVSDAQKAWMRKNDGYGWRCICVRRTRTGWKINLLHKKVQQRNVLYGLFEKAGVIKMQSQHMYVPR